MKADIYALFCLLNLCFQVEGVRDSNEKRHPMIKGRLISIHDEATEQVKKGVEVVRGKVISKPLSLKQLLKHLDHKDGFKHLIFGNLNINMDTKEQHKSSSAAVPKVLGRVLALNNKVKRGTIVANPEKVLKDKLGMIPKVKARVLAMNMEG